MVEVSVQRFVFKSVDNDGNEFLFTVEKNGTNIFVRDIKGPNLTRPVQFPLGAA